MESKPEHGTNLWPSNFHNLNPEQQIYYATSLSKQSNSLKKKPFAHTTGDIKKLVQRFVTPGTKISGEFSWALSFDPSFIARLAKEGFLPMSGQIFADLICLLPKLHKERCLMILNLDELKINNGARKRAKQFNFTVDQNFNQVIAGCQQQHGEHCWFYAPLTAAYRHIFQQNKEGGVDGVRLHSCEIWSKETGELVGGELGYAVGGVYTSLSGFRQPGSKSAGSIQCCCTAILLQRLGFSMWDLGMGMKYKLDLGAKNITRINFLEYLNEYREMNDCVLSCPEKIDADELFQWHKATVGGGGGGGSGGGGGGAAEEGEGEKKEQKLSKRAQKKLAKKKKKIASKLAAAANAGSTGSGSSAGIV